LLAHPLHYGLPVGYLIPKRIEFAARAKGTARADKQSAVSARSVCSWHEAYGNVAAIRAAEQDRSERFAAIGEYRLVQVGGQLNPGQAIGYGNTDRLCCVAASF
jgi:hypothetical protein